MESLEINHDMFAHAPHASDARVLQCGGDLGGRRLQRLRLRPQPNRVDDVTCHSLIQAASDGLDFGKLRHKKAVYKKSRQSSGFSPRASDVSGQASGLGRQAAGSVVRLSALQRCVKP